MIKLSWKDILKKEGKKLPKMRQRSPATLQRMADVEVELGKLIEEGITTVLHQMDAHSIDELQREGEEDPINVYHSGGSTIYVDTEDDFYLQVYVSGTDTKKVEEGEEHRSKFEIRPIGTYHWPSMKFNLDARLFDNIDGKTLRSLVPTMETRNWRKNPIGTQNQAVEPGFEQLPGEDEDVV